MKNKPSLKVILVTIFLLSMGLSRHIVYKTPELSPYTRRWYMGPFARVFVNDSRLHQLKFTFNYTNTPPKEVELKPGQWDRGTIYGFYVRQAVVGALTASMLMPFLGATSRMMKIYLCGSVDTKDGFFMYEKPLYVSLHSRINAESSYVFKYELPCENKKDNP